MEDYDYYEWDEISVEEGMLHGIDAYNEIRGSIVEELGPCGHHCDDSCPRCGTYNPGPEEEGPEEDEDE